MKYELSDLPLKPKPGKGYRAKRPGQGLTLVQFSAQRKRILWDRGCI